MRGAGRYEVSSFEFRVSKYEYQCCLRARFTPPKCSVKGRAFRRAAINNFSNFVIPTEGFSPSEGTCCSAVPTGLGFIIVAYPALKRWAKLFRPAARDCGS